MKIAVIATRPEHYTDFYWQLSIDFFFSALEMFSCIVKGFYLETNSGQNSSWISGIIV